MEIENDQFVPHLLLTSLRLISGIECCDNEPTC